MGDLPRPAYGQDWNRGEAGTEFRHKRWASQTRLCERNYNQAKPLRESRLINANQRFRSVGSAFYLAETPFERRFSGVRKERVVVNQEDDATGRPGLR